jgi:alpha-amylase/alpha-mannosidase (GH57 family)
MTHTVTLLLGVHAHQPVGNFPEVLEDAHFRCYKPFIHTLHRFPEFRFAIHFSGWLLDWLLERYPEDMALLREMVQRGQAELVGAGDTEPVLAVIPYRDRVGQIVALSDKLEQRFGQRPEGAWLTERVWEATVVPALADSGIGYVTVDDYHFLCAGRRMEELNGYFTTEEDGRRLDLFPISEALRYRLPFSTAAEAVGYLESLAREEGDHAAAIYFDDIEKFGIWPETYQWVYEKGWLADFIQGVLASPHIRTGLYREYHQAARTRGVVYLPTTSYIEMNEWTLPAQEANEFADLVQNSKNAGQFERQKAFLRGGIWKNFFSRYPESNWMHKRMLQLSARFDALPEKHKTAALRRELYDAQANDAYWHGLFGGLYLPHLRRAVYRAMVALEGELDRLQPRSALEWADLDLDGVEEAFLHNDILQAVVAEDGAAAVRELDAYALKHNFGDTLRRQPEHYYRKIQLQEGAHQHKLWEEGIASAHDRVSFKHVITSDDLVFDGYGRALFLDTVWQEGEEALPVRDYAAESRRREGTLEYRSSSCQLHKVIALEGNKLNVAYHFHGKAHHGLRTEINLAMPSCDGPAGHYAYQGDIPCGFGQVLELDGMSELVLEDAVLGGKVVLRSSRPAKLVGRPHFTVSQSEAGFEKIMQAVTLTLSWEAAAHHKPLEVSLEIIPKA